MTSVEFVFGWVRVAMYFFTTVSLALAAAAVFRPVSKSIKRRNSKAGMFLMMSLFTAALGVAGVLRMTGYVSHGVWIINFPLTVVMIALCYFSWKYVIETSRLYRDIQNELLEGEC